MNDKTDIMVGASKPRSRSGDAHRSAWTTAAALLLLAGSTALGTTAARAVELVPSYGLTRATDGDQTKSNVGLALRTGLAGPVLQSELGVSYRSEEYYDGALRTKMVPVTASLLVRPIPTIHADAGVGWYHTNYDYAVNTPTLADETRQQFGVHVGGGLEMPIAPGAALDLTGRYVFMESQESKLVPTKFDPDFWSMSLGLALKL
jgi:hypothetical protein